jgi:hypothetical protein
VRVATGYQAHFLNDFNRFEFLHGTGKSGGRSVHFKPRALVPVYTFDSYGNDGHGYGYGQGDYDDHFRLTLTIMATITMITDVVAIRMIVRQSTQTREARRVPSLALASSAFVSSSLD